MVHRHRKTWSATASRPSKDGAVVRNLNRGFDKKLTTAFDHIVHSRAVHNMPVDGLVARKASARLLRRTEKELALLVQNT